MKKTTAISLLFAAATLYALYVGCGQGTPDASKSTAAAPKAELMATPRQASRLPQDVLQSCIISQSDFNSWFATGTASENGIVLPANSVTFGHTNNCDFYKWSWQMFAWLVSPLAPNETVMASPTFYTVSPANATNQRFLLKHVKGQPLLATSSIPQTGPHGLPTIMDKKGNLFEVEKPVPNVKPMLLMGVKKTMISKVEMDANNKPVFKDQAGKMLVNPKAMLLTKGNVVQEFKTATGKSVFVGANGPIDSEEGQAGGSHGLMAQNGSIVYYITMVNDVFAVYLSAVSTKQMSGLQFPITAAQRDSLVVIAKANNIDLPDPNALAMEIKTSWVDASTLPDAANYITIDATIPTYNKTNPKQWIPIPNGQQNVKLALLGVHVVGSTAGHPEMVWATFEHQRNAPFAAYQYLNNKNVVDTVPADSQGKWTLSSNPLDPAPNSPHFTANVDTLNAVDPFTVSASNSSLVFPWGSEMGVAPNAADGSSAASNSEVISINNSIFGWLVNNDIRKNYMLIGATWTSGGVAPSGKNFTTTPKDPAAAIGTSILANSTMETYKQSTLNSCFGCHSVNGTGSGGPATLAPGVLSHIYTATQPLPNFKVIPRK